MDYAQYVETAQQGAQFVEAGDFDQALTRFRTLLASDISDLDKSRMCYNIAVVYEKMDNEREALYHYDRGMGYERPHGRSFVAEQKAGYLSRLGRMRECLRQYEALLGRPSLTEEEKYRIRHNVDVLREQVR